MALFRPSRLLPRPLQWRQFWPVLELDTDRASVELRISAQGWLQGASLTLSPSFRDIAQRWTRNLEIVERDSGFDAAHRPGMAEEEPLPSCPSAPDGPPWR